MLGRGPCAGLGRVTLSRACRFFERQYTTLGKLLKRRGPHFATPVGQVVSTRLFFSRAASVVA